jgi:hypothetical protein
MRDLDGANNVTRAWRQGSGAGASQMTLSGAAYDVSGQLLRETNALDGVTAYTESITPGVETIRTTILPNNAQRIETSYPDGRLKSITGTAVPPVFYEYGADADGLFTKEIQGDPSGTEWVKTYTDMLGHVWKTVYPDGAYSQSWYDALGRMEKQRDPDGLMVLSAYNNKGELEYTALDANLNGQIDLDGPDRVTRTESDVVTLDAAALWPNTAINRTRVWQRTGENTDLLVSEQWASVDGTRSASIAFGLTNQTFSVVDAAARRRTVTTIAPDGTSSVSVFENGQLISATSKDRLGDQLSAIGYSYDAHGRQSMISDARNGTTILGYHPKADLVETVTTPAPAAGQPPLTTTTRYNTLMQATDVVYPDNTSAHTAFYPNGLPRKTWGSRTYPVEYTYDSAGRKKTMTTWQDAASRSGAAVTTWNYNPQRG